MVILGAQVQVAQQDGQLGADEGQAQEDHEQKAKQVVDLVEPQTVHDEGELAVDGGKGQDPAQQDGGHGVQAEGLVGHLSRDLVRADGVGDFLPLSYASKHNLPIS